MKADHPRTIDRSIDFFGDPGMARAAVATRATGDRGAAPGVAAAPEGSSPDHPER
jgi:hypothetical protein